MTKQEISLEENFTTWCKVNNVSIISKAILLGIIEKHSALQQKQSLAALREEVRKLADPKIKEHEGQIYFDGYTEALDDILSLLQDKEGEEREI